MFSRSEKINPSRIKFAIMSSGRPQFYTEFDKSDDEVRLKVEAHEMLIKGKEKAAQKEFQEKLSSFEGQKTEMKKKILELQVLLKDEKEKAARQDERIKVLEKEVADRDDWVKNRLARLNSSLPLLRMARRGLHQPQPESEA